MSAGNADRLAVGKEKARIEANFQNLWLNNQGNELGKYLGEEVTGGLWGNQGFDF